VREGNTRGLFRNTAVFNLLAGEPEYLDPLKDETPAGWWVTGYPWGEINTPEHKAFRDAYQKRWKDYPRQGSVVGYTAIHAVAEALRKAKSVETEKLVEAFKGLEMRTPFGPITWRAIDHQSTMGAYVGQLAKKDGKGTMVNWRYADGANYQPADQEIRALRKE
jgi:branched-chain amino acid transport system substrate-binding protein